MISEIGGYFGLEETHGDKEYYPGLIALNTARNALVYAMKARGIKKVNIPFFLCDSVAKVLDREDFQYCYYHIDNAFRPVFEKELANDEWLYIVNIYGQIGNDQILFYKNKYKRIIVDNTHAFFQKPLDGIDTIYSCRKFFGVADGAYLSTNCFIKETLEQDISDDRTKHIYGRIKDGAPAHYSEFKANDESFKSLPLKTMSELTHNMLSNMDYGYILSKRNDNFSLLYNALKDFNGIAISKPDGPYAYPFYCKDGMKIKKVLAEQKIYVATLWPNCIEYGGLEKDFAENILPLPCDQRYGKEEMLRVIEEIKKCIG